MEQIDTVLLDLDAWTHRAAYAADSEHCELSGVEVFKFMMDNLIKHLQETFPNGDIHYVLSDSKNFRMELSGGYKSNRPPKPTTYTSIKQYAIDTYPCITRPYLEADDLIAAMHDNSKGNSVVVGLDKDFFQVEGWKYRPPLKLGKDTKPRKAELNYVYADDAYKFIYYQALAGDASDGIKGIRGYGEGKGWMGHVTSPTWEKVIGPCTTEWQCYQEVLALYIEAEKGKHDTEGQEVQAAMEVLYYNLNMLYLRRFNGDMWLMPQGE